MAKVVFGENDLYTWCLNNKDRGEKLLKEWQGIDINNKPLDIKRTAVQSNKNVLWKCTEGHTWYTKVQKRTLLGSNCPYCANNAVIKGKNDLRTWCINNNKIYILNEFVGKDEYDNILDPSEIGKSTAKKVFWKHIVNNEEHIWLARVADRTNKLSGCPYCNGKNVTIKGKNDLLTWCNKNGEIGKIFKEQWVGITDTNKLIGMDEIAESSHTNVAWLCECGNFWYQSPLKRKYRKNIGCAKCSREQGIINREASKVKNGGSLLDWCNNNKIIGDIIKNQFVGKDENDNDIDIDKVTYGSQLKVKWQHTTEDGEIHNWIASIHNRVCRKSMCPICNNYGTSLPEQIIYRSLKKTGLEVENRSKYLGYEFDIVIKNPTTFIEYNSVYYHIGRECIDIEKIEVCKNNNIKLLRIIDDREINEDIFSDKLIQARIGKDFRKIKIIVDNILQKYNRSITNEDYEKVINESIKFMLKDNKY